jgi:hypothetical protein
VNVYDMMPPAERRRVMAEEAKEAREWEMQKLDAQLAAEANYERAVFNEHLFEAQHGMSRHEWERRHQQMADARPERDPSAPYGSERNPATLIGGQMLDPRPVARSRQPVRDLTEDDIRDLTRSRQYESSIGHRVMVAEVRRFDQRRGY